MPFLTFTVKDLFLEKKKLGNCSHCSINFLPITLIIVRQIRWKCGRVINFSKREVWYWVQSNYKISSFFFLISPRYQKSPIGLIDSAISKVISMCCRTVSLWKLVRCFYPFRRWWKISDMIEKYVRRCMFRKKGYWIWNRVKGGGWGRRCFLYWSIE